jgi:hypothetical protein
MADDSDAAVSQFLQRAYFIVVQFWRRPYEFERLQVHPFSKQLGQKLRNPSSTKWIMYLMMQATTTKGRRLASQYAVILNGLMQDQVVVTAVAARINELGGIKAAYESMRGRDQSSSLQIGRRPKQTFPLYPLVAPLLEQETPPYDEGEENNVVWGESVFGFVHWLARKYAEIKNGDRQAVSRVLQGAYLAVRDMQRDPDEFARLQADQFFKPPWRRPKDDSTSKWLMYFIVQARSPEVRHLAGTYAEILDGLQQDQVEIGAVAARIKELGGIKATYQAMRARNNAP